MIGGRRAWQVGVLAAALAGGEARGDTDVGDHAGAAGAAAGAGKRVVVLADRVSAAHREIADELRVKLHRSHPGAALEVEQASDRQQRRELGERVGRGAPDVAVVLGPAMIDDALGSLPATAVRLYGDLGEHDARLDRLQAQGLTGVVDLCPAESLLRLATRLAPDAAQIGWSRPEDTRRASLEPALAAAARALGVSVMAGDRGPARLLFVLPAGQLDPPAGGQGGAKTTPGQPRELRVTCSAAAFERGAAAAAFVSEPEEVGEALARQAAAALDGKAPVDERIEGATVRLDPEAACEAGAAVDAVLLARSVVRGERRTCDAPSVHRERLRPARRSEEAAGWMVLGALVAVGAFATRGWLARRGRRVRG